MKRLLRRAATLLCAVFLLIVSCVLQLAFGLLLMGYDDSNSGEWTSATFSLWISSLSSGYRLAFFVSAVGAQTTFMAGVALVIVGLRRLRKRTSPDSGMTAPTRPRGGPAR